jgi:hypothetical protein
MPAATITLKVSAAEKRQLQARARREKKSLNAYLLGKVAGADVSQRGRVDYEKLTAQLGGKFRSLELWKQVLDRE